MEPRTHAHASAHTPRLTLYCLPHAGGGAAGYVRWRHSLPSGIDLVPMELPGHGSRLAERPIDRLVPLVDHLVGRVRAGAGGHTALLGHSFGALLAFEVARRLTALGDPPAALLVCGRDAPTEPSARVAARHLPDDAFLAAVRRLGGIPAELDEHPDLVRAYLPALRADLRMAEEYRRGDGPALDVPILAFGGRDDVLTRPDGLVGWNRETTATFDLTVLPGGHFFIRTPAFLDAVRWRLERVAATAAP